MYSSPQKQACETAFEIADESQVRAYIGLPLMDRNTPEILVQNTEQVINDIFSIAKKWHKKNKCEFVLTPRFALSCTEELLTKVGEIAETDNFFVQTHLAENKKEVQEVKFNFLILKIIQASMIDIICSHRRRYLLIAYFLMMKKLRKLTKETV
jgi:guanine deaminase